MKSGALSYRSVMRVLVVVAVILLVPLLAMQLTDEVAWTVSDFAIAGVVLAATGLLYEVAASRAGSLIYRAAIGVALGAGLFLVWAVLAVGAIGAEGDPADLMYFGVLAVGVVGAIMVRLDPNGMVGVLLVMALGIAVVAIVALIAGRHLTPESSVAEIVAVNAFFAALFTASAWLFRRAAHDQRLRGVAPRA